MNKGPARTVGELIALLQQLPTDSTLCVSAWDGTDYLCLDNNTTPDSKVIWLVG